MEYFKSHFFAQLGFFKERIMLLMVAHLAHFTNRVFSKSNDLRQQNIKLRTKGKLKYGGELLSYRNFIRYVQILAGGFFALDAVRGA